MQTCKPPSCSAGPSCLQLCRLFFVQPATPGHLLVEAGVLHQLAAQWEIRALALRPTLPLRSGSWTPRKEDKLGERFLLRSYY